VRVRAAAPWGGGSVRWGAAGCAGGSVLHRGGRSPNAVKPRQRRRLVRGGWGRRAGAEDVARRRRCACGAAGARAWCRWHRQCSGMRAPRRPRRGPPALGPPASGPPLPHVKPGVGDNSFREASLRCASCVQRGPRLGRARHSSDRGELGAQVCVSHFFLLCAAWAWRASRRKLRTAAKRG